MVERWRAVESRLIIAPVSRTKLSLKFRRGLSRERTSSISLPGTEEKLTHEICLLRTFFRRHLKDSRVASCRPRRVVFMRRKFPSEIKTSRLGATRWTVAAAAVAAACNYLLMTHKPAIFSRQQAARHAENSGRERRDETFRAAASLRFASRRRSVRNRRSVWRQVRRDRWRTEVWDLQRARQLMSQLFLPSSFAPAI